MASTIPQFRARLRTFAAYLASDKQHLAGQLLLEKSNIPNVVFLTLGVWEAFTLDAYRKGNLASPYTPSGQHARHEYTYESIGLSRWQHPCAMLWLAEARCSWF